MRGDISNNNCPNCKVISFNKYIRVERWWIYKCKNCDLLFTINPDKSGEVKKFYDNKYIAGYTRRKTELKKRFREYLKLIEKYKQGGTILDIGCGMGYFIQVASVLNNHSWIAIGLEQDGRLIRRAHEFIKQRIVLGKMSALPFKQNLFDCVTCFDVLEHNAKLSKNLSEIKRVLKKDGLLVIQAPNYKSLMAYITGREWDWWATPDHVLHFSYDFLVNYLEQNDFMILKKFTYERTADFLLNIKGRFRKHFIMKILYYCCIPILLLLERLAWQINYGALSFVIARNKK